MVCGHVIVTLANLGRFHTKLGDTIGGIGSAIALSSFSPGTNGTFTGKLIVQPDRGYNVCVPPSSRPHSCLHTIYTNSELVGKLQSITRADSWLLTLL